MPPVLTLNTDLEHHTANKSKPKQFARTTYDRFARWDHKSVNRLPPPSSTANTNPARQIPIYPMMFDVIARGKSTTNEYRLVPIPKPARVEKVTKFVERCESWTHLNDDKSMTSAEKAKRCAAIATELHNTMFSWRQIHMGGNVKETSYATQFRSLTTEFLELSRSIKFTKDLIRTVISHAELINQ